MGQKRRKTKRWVRHQQQDTYVRKAASQGIRARSYFKLAQIDRKYHLIHSSSRVVDLGCAPGGWAQYVASRITSSGRIVAMDIAPMESVPGVHFVQGDINSPDACKDVLACLDRPTIDLVLSDMAPNITGIRSADEANMGRILASVFGFTGCCLRTGGALLVKFFEGETAISGRRWINTYFDHVHTIKPDASRAKSREFYLVGRGYRGLVDQEGQDIS